VVMRKQANSINSTNAEINNTLRQYIFNYAKSSDHRTQL